ncbi:MAG: PAS domain S-box protein [Coleofasciculus sp. S288]|nr:PAS domain S-box protein [Coleofasciculus sp. S288]
MITTGDESLLIQQIDAVQQRTQELYQNVRETSQHHPLLLLDCLAQLQVALEELYVAEQELRQQNEELIAARQAAEAERKRYQELFEFAPDGYLVTDIHGTIQEVNRAAAELLNVAQKHLMGKPLTAFVPEEERKAFRFMINQLQTVNRVQEWEVRLCKRREALFDAALTVETVRNGEGEAIALRWLIRDITVRKQAEAQLHQVQMQNLQLLEADRLKNQFMATMSHELRTPMNAILGFSQLLLRQFRQQDNQQLVTMIERIVKNGKHLLEMIEEILDFSRLKAHRLELQLEAFDLVELATTTAEELRALAEQKTLNLQVHLTQPSIPMVNDQVRLRQVLVNLLSNAIKFTEVGSVALKIWELPEGRVAIAVSDTGIGINSADQARIFQEFWQVNQTTTRQQKGTGLGLAIANSLVQLMQGTISVESQVGKGSTFRVELPRRVSPL